eukprot:1543279-Amphidinium_carterae.1
MSGDPVVLDQILSLNTSKTVFDGMKLCSNHLYTVSYRMLFNRSCSVSPIPGSLKATAVGLGHNLLEGSIPEPLLDGRDPGWDPLQKWVVARTSEAQSP